MSEEPTQSPRQGNETIKGYCTLCARTAYIREGKDFNCPVCSSSLFQEDQVPNLESR
jgi:hypothetical protein